MLSFLKRLDIDEINPGGCHGIDKWLGSGDVITSINPSNGQPIAKVRLITDKEFDTIIRSTSSAFKDWRELPAPKRGDIVRQLGSALREKKDDLGKLVTLEMGKSLEEGKGEVQEAIDMADFATGLSRQLCGKVMQSERPQHRLYEQWLPLGPVGIITSFNFPMAVWGWNAMISYVCGDTTLWKPSTKVPLCGIAIQHIANKVFADNGWDSGIACLCCGRGSTIGNRISNDTRIPLVSATGSVAMGKKVSTAVAGRLGKTILELGGNNAIIVSKEADLDTTLPSLFFGAIGTAGQRCTTIRRVIVHSSVRDELVSRLIGMYKKLKIGNPLEPENNFGPLIDPSAVKDMAMAIESALDQGGNILYGGDRARGNFVEPTIIEMPGNVPIVCNETFAPILYVISYENFDEAIELQNEVPQGLASSIFSNNLGEVEMFLSARGSDCGIANVNISTSGAEIGGAFGGEKDTGGGREAGSDAWKAYMRRQTVTVNWGKEMHLSQGIDFS